MDKTIARDQAAKNEARAIESRSFVDPRLDATHGTVSLLRQKRKRPSRELAQALARPGILANWPKTGDSLFGSGDWNAEAALGVFVGNGFYQYATAYKDAAEALVEGLLAGNLVADSAVYPALFLYRHYVELILKGINQVGEQLYRTTKTSVEGHQIDELWRTARPQLEQAFPERQKADSDAVEKCIRELASIDPSGQALRYARRLQRQGGGPTLPSVVQVNLAHFRDMMNGLSVFLDGSY